MFVGGVFLSVPLLCALPLMVLVIIIACLNTYLVLGLPSHTSTVDQPVPTPAEVAIEEPMATLAALATEVAALSQTPSN